MDDGMLTGSRPQAPAHADVQAFRDELAALQAGFHSRRYDTDGSSDGSGDTDGSNGSGDTDLRRVLVEDLESAHEELRIADEEVRTQQEELQRLIHTQRTGRWQHERLLAALPAAIIVTDAQGMISTVNAAAATMLRMRIDRLVRKPLQAFVDTSDRADLRRELSAAVADGGDFRRMVTLTPRDRQPVQVELSASVTPGGPMAETEVTWLLLHADDSPEFPHQSQALLAAAFAELTQIPLVTTETHAVLSRVAEVCGGVLGPRFSVSVGVGEPTSPERTATSSKLAQNIDGAQNLANEGPCHSAWLDTEPVLSHDVKADGRWPQLAHHLHGEPVRGALAVPIQLGHDLIGSLNAYTETEDVSKSLLRVLELLGTAVAAILHEVDQRSELESLAQNLQEALTSRAAIDQAKGIVMAKYGCGPDEAFQRLVRLSSETNIKLRDIARMMVDAAASGRTLPSELDSSTQGS